MTDVVHRYAIRRALTSCGRAIAWPARVAANRHGRRHLVQRPAWCFVAARDAAQGHPLLLEVQHRVVPVQAAEHLPQPVEHATAKPSSLRLVRRLVQTFVSRSIGDSS